MIYVEGCIPLAAKLHGSHGCSSSVFFKPWIETRENSSDCPMVQTEHS